jgi:hypothetical protein
LYILNMLYASIRVKVIQIFFDFYITLDSAQILPLSVHKQLCDVIAHLDEFQIAEALWADMFTSISSSRSRVVIALVADQVVQ